MAGNWLFPDEPLWDKARAWFTGMGAKDPLGLNIPPQETVSVPRGDFVPMEKALMQEKLRNAMQIANFAGGIRAFHGSPHKFTRFDSSKIGTGEGAQAFGHGHYLAERERVAQEYRDKLSFSHGKVELVDGKTGQVLVPELKEAQNLLTGFMKRFGGYPADIQAQLTSWRNTIDDLRYTVDDYRHEVNTTTGNKRKWYANELAVAEKKLKGYEEAHEMLKRGNFLPRGHMYEVDINTTPNRLLDWDKPFSGQSPYVQGQVGDFVQQRIDRINTARTKRAEQIQAKLARGEKLSSHELKELPQLKLDDFSGRDIYKGKTLELDPKEGRAGPDASEFFRSRGVPGVQYLDAGSRGAGQGSRNYVIFDDNLLDILRRYGTLGPVSAGVVNSLLGGQDDPRQ